MTCFPARQICLLSHIFHDCPESVFTKRLPFMPLSIIGFTVVFDCQIKWTVWSVHAFWPVAPKSFVSIYRTVLCIIFNGKLFRFECSGTVPLSSMLFCVPFMVLQVFLAQFISFKFYVSPSKFMIFSSSAKSKKHCVL